MLNELLVLVEPLENNVLELQKIASHLNEVYKEEQDSTKAKILDGIASGAGSPITDAEMIMWGKVVGIESIEETRAKTKAELKEEYARLEAICNSQAEQLNDFRNQIAFYTEIGLDVNYSSVLKIDEDLRTDSQKDFMIQRQQYYYNKDIKNYGLEIKNAQ